MEQDRAQIMQLMEMQEQQFQNVLKVMAENHSKLETMMHDATQNHSKQIARLCKKIDILERRAKDEEQKEVKVIG